MQSTQVISNRVALLIFLFLLPVGWLFPVVLSFFLFVVSMINKDVKYSFLATSFLVVFFSVVNLSKVVEGDLAWYLEDYADFLYFGYFDYFSYDYRAKLTEPLYHFFSYILSVLTGGSESYFVATVTFIIYYLSALFVAKILLNVLAVSYSDDVVLVLVFFIFFGILFSQALNLIRQYIACVLLLLSFLFFFEGRNKRMFLFFILAFLTHNSVFVFLPLFLLGVVLVSRKLRDEGLLFSIFAAFFLGGVVAVIYIVSFFIFGQASRLYIDDGSVSWVVKSFDLILLLGMSFALRNKAGTESGSRKLVLVYAYFSFVGFLVVSHYSEFLSLRYYFYMDFLRWIPFYFLLSAVSLNSLGKFLALFVLFFSSIFYMNFRMEMSPFEYGFSFWDGVVFLPFGVFNYIDLFGLVG
ncbi:EpsG family protein [Salinibius halmophilus]|uniref:EpsG family protein n=1 Tax=Salinibius halmophilus TaxID=1853216 RepID=UPI0013145135|nr:EpsG family protein [Salinibius halmophilus]